MGIIDKYKESISMYTRRNFLKMAEVAGATGLANPIKAFCAKNQISSDYFGVHEFIENHPDAVFIMQSDVDKKTNNDAKKQVGLDFGRSVFVPKDNTGFLISSIVPIKPNLKPDVAKDPVNRMGMDTDAFFVEGIIESLKDIGLSGDQFYMREAWCISNGKGGSADWDANGFAGVCERTGANLKDCEIGVGGLPAEDINWVDVPDGVWYRKIPYLWPINVKDGFLLNIAKFKTHGMGLTLCSKNMQGTVSKPYTALCQSITASYGSMNPENFRLPDGKAEIYANYDRHNADGIPRWDKPGSSGDSGLGQETWSTRTLDNLSTMSFGLNIIEGIYGRDGNGHSNGPNPAGNENNSRGMAWDHMSNVVIFGKNPIHVDNIGHWLGGHEPGNFGFFHLALERKMSSYLDPKSIPVYLWKDGVATLTPLDDFERTMLMTNYLTRNYNGQTENCWHLANEPFDYGSVSVEPPYTNGKAEAFILSRNIPNLFNPYTSIEYSIPSAGNVRIEIFNASGQLIDVLVNGQMSRGSHMAVWNTSNQSSGVYTYRFRFGGFNKTETITLLK